MTATVLSPPLYWDETTRRVVLLMEYVGTAFSGSQIQENSHTIQAALLLALKQLQIIHRPLHFAGRTDAGVHAKGQVVHFDTTIDQLAEIPDLTAALNATLPEAISIKQAVVTEEYAFHALRSAEWRWYRYQILNQSTRSAWMPPDTVWIKQALDIEAMQAATQYFLGPHAFTSFKCSHTPVKNDVCNIRVCQLRANGTDLTLDIIANRFLYNMVRIMMGTLLEVGFGQRSAEMLSEILMSTDRRLAGKTAKPNGLSLMAIDYPSPWDFFKPDVYVTTLKQHLQESSSDENLLRKAS